MNGGGHDVGDIDVSTCGPGAACPGCSDKESLNGMDRSRRYRESIHSAEIYQLIYYVKKGPRKVFQRELIFPWSIR